MSLAFEKWTALGNDYVILGAPSLPWDLTPERVRRICDPHFGIGSDGILLLSPSEDRDLVADLRIFNPDGSEAELSGNGVREAAMYLHRHGWTPGPRFSIGSMAGAVTPEIVDDRRARVAMGRASTSSKDYPSGGRDGTGTLTAGGREWRFQHVSIGNPQCVIEAGEEVEALDLASIGPEIERSELFPNRTNVSFIAIDGGAVRARIFERGVGETLSSGTGACGAAVAAVLMGSSSPVAVRLDGGELEVEVADDLEVHLTGWAEPICSGQLSEDLVAALAEI